MDFHVDIRGSTILGIHLDHKHQHGLEWHYRPQAPTWPAEEAQSTEVFQGGPIRKLNHFPSWSSCCCSVSEITWLGRIFGGRTCSSSRLLHTTLLTLLNSDLCLHPPQPHSHTWHCHQVSSSTSLCSALFPTFPLHICSSKWHCKLRRVTQYISKQFYMQILTVMNHWSGSRFQKHHKYCTIAKIPLGYSAVARVKVILQLDRVSGGRIYINSRLLYTSLP